MNTNFLILLYLIINNMSLNRRLNRRANYTSSKEIPATLHNLLKHGLLSEEEKIKLVERFQKEGDTEALNKLTLYHSRFILLQKSLQKESLVYIL
ncbi:MAG: hypothetical protein ABH804_00885 [archaeon]